MTSAEFISTSSATQAGVASTLPAVSGVKAEGAAKRTFIIGIDESSFLDAFSSHHGSAPSMSLMRESTVLSLGLDRFAGVSGGTLLQVEASQSDRAFDRVLSETVGYYLLGVELKGLDRDGRAHFIDVRIKGIKDVVIRSRKVVTLPR